MRIKFKTFLIIWMVFTLLLSLGLIFGFNTYMKTINAVEPKECIVEENIVGLPNVKIVEKEVEVVKNVEVVNYEFPFEVGEEKIVKTKGVCNCCLPTRKYPNMRSNANVTVFASNDLYKEGTLLWVEGIGIRQVQPLVNSSDTLYISFENHTDVENYGNKSVKVFEIKE